ncbi:MAG: phage tail tape measure protein [Frankiales bacterium]|nr:phage tail tape measure protein [Frankiales bacterium]
MSDYVVAVGFETDAGTVKRSTDQLADSVGKVGQAQGAAAKNTRDLTSASSQLELVRRKMVLQEQKLADATSAVQRLQARGVTTGRQYTRALQEQLTAQDRLTASMLKAERLQSGGGTGGGAAGSRLGRNLAGAAAGYLTGAAVGRLVTDSVAEYGRLNQAVSQNRQTFGAYSADVDRFGKGAAHSIGLSRQAAIEASDGLGTLFQTLQIGQGDAARMSTRLVALSADVAAFNHAQQPEVLAAFKGGLTGQYDALQKYNVVLNTASVRQEAVRLGLVQGKDALSQTTQAQAAYSLIVQQTNGQQGAFLTSGDRYVRQQAQVTAALQNAKAELGKGLGPALLGLSHIAEDTVIPALSGLGKAIGFIGSHDSTRKIAELLLILYGVGKAVDIGTAAVDRLALAWGRVAVSAGTATAAETAAAGAGAGGALGGLGKLGRAGGATLGPGLVITALITNEHANPKSAAEKVIQDPAVRRELGLDPLNAQKQKQAADTQLRAAESARATASYTAKQQTALTRSVGLTAAADAARQGVAHALVALHDRPAIAAAAAQQPLPGLFAVPTSATKRIDLSSDNSSVASARRAVKLAEDRLNALRAGAPAEVAAASRAVSLTEARLSALEQSGKASALQIQAARNSLSTAEERLTRLKDTGKGSTLQLEAAENRLADARDRLNRATGKRSKDQEKNNQDTSISAKDILKRADATAATATTEVRNVRKLVAAGLTAPVIEELKTLEQSAPGTIANVAKAITPAFVRRLNADAAARARAATALAMLGGQARYNDSVRQAKILGAQAGKAFHDGWLAGLNGTGLRQGLPLDDTRPYTGPAPKPTSTASTPTARQGIPRDDLRVASTALPKVTAPAPTVNRQGIPLDERTTASLPTRSINPSPVVHLSSDSVTRVATSLATMAPRTTQISTGPVVAHDYDDFLRQAREAELLQNTRFS